jgi:hypothetical protein
VQRRLADAVETQFQDVDQRETQAWKTLAEARDAGVPITHLVERSRRPRPTLYRRLDELGYGNPENRTWTLAIKDDPSMAELRQFMTLQSIKAKPTRSGDTIVVQMSGKEGLEDLEEIADHFRGLGHESHLA